MHFYSCIIHAYEMHVECCELAVSNGCTNGVFTCILHVIPLHFPCCFPATTLQLCYMCYAFKRVQHEFNSVFHAFPKKVKCMSHSFKLHAKCIQTCKPYEFITVCTMHLPSSIKLHAQCSYTTCAMH